MGIKLILCELASDGLSISMHVKLTVLANTALGHKILTDSFNILIASICGAVHIFLVAHSAWYLHSAHIVHGTYRYKQIPTDT